MKTDKTGLEKFLEFLYIWRDENNPEFVSFVDIETEARSLLAAEKAATEKAQGQQDGGLEVAIYKWAVRTKLSPGSFLELIRAIDSNPAPQSVEAQKPIAPAGLMEAIEKFATQYGGIPGRELIKILDDYRPIPSTDNPREDCVQKGIEEMITEGGV